MGADTIEHTGPDLTEGVPESALAEGAMLEGQVEGEPVLLARTGGEVFAVGARCTHYGGPLAEGIIVGETVRCPWHHACFSLRSGEATCAPALDPIARYAVAREGDTIRVGAKLEPEPLAGAAASPPATFRPAAPPSRMVIVGAGAAGNAAAEMLRREGFDGQVVLIGGERDLPYDRPNLSKDYLAGTAKPEWIPLRSREFYRDRGIELVLGTRASGLDLSRREVRLLDGRTIPFDRLLLATGAEPVRLPVPTHGLSHVFTLRSLADANAIIAAAERASRAVVVGASFIGLEVAASLRARGIEVHVVAPEQIPFERILGAQVGMFVRQVHEEHGVVFHLGNGVRAISARSVSLKCGAELPADLVVVGIGVRPDVALAQWAKLEMDAGVVVDERLETSAPDIFAAGDIARWPDPHSGDRIRVEHWVVAERMGQTAARNMLGAGQPFTAVPFFWSQHHDAVIGYVGHHEVWDEIDIDGRLDARDCTIRYRRRGRVLAVATVGRDRESLRAEAAIEIGATA